MKSQDILSLFFSKRFLPFFLCGFIGIFIDNLVKTAFITFVAYQLTDITSVTKGVVINLSLVMLMLPMIFLSPLAGILADKFNKTTLIKYIRLFSLLYVLIASLGFYLGNFYIILLAIFLGGCEIAISNPVKYGILPDLLKRNELIAGNSIVGAGVCSGVLLGIIIGGMVQSNSMIFLMTSISLVSVSLILSFLIPQTTAANPSLKITFNIIADIKSTIAMAKSENSIFLAIQGISWFWVIFGVTISQLPTLVQETMSSSQSVLVMLYSVFSISMCLGALFCNKLLKDDISTRYVSSSALLVAISLIGLCYVSNVFVPRPFVTGIHHLVSSWRGLGVVAMVFSIGFFSSIYVIPLYTLLQADSKKVRRSRMVAANSITNAFFVCAATFIAILMVSICMTPIDILSLLALCSSLTAVYICKLLPDQVIRNMMIFALRLFYRIEVTGLENYQSAGQRVLIVSNHTSYLDPIILASIIRERLVFTLDPYITHSWFMKPLLAILRISYVDITDPMSIKKLISRLKEDKNVVMFPEGRVTKTGSLMKIYEEPGMIADKADAKLLPILIEGGEFSPFSMMDERHGSKIFPKIKVKIMKAQRFKAPDDVTARERRRIISAKLYDVMSNMMFEGGENNGTIFQSLVDAKKQFGGNKIIIADADHNQISYKKLLVASFAFGTKFFKQTNASKENVGIMLPNTAGAIITFFACQIFGITPCMINFSSGSKNIIRCCKIAQIKKIYTSRRFIDKAELHDIESEIKSAGIEIFLLEDIRQSISLLDKIKAMYLATFPLRFYRKIHKNLRRQKMPQPNSVAVILFTSGSEGAPKGVLLSHKNIHSNLCQLSSVLDLSTKDIVFNALPIFHCFGLVICSLLPIMHGMKVMLYPSPLHYRIIPEMIYRSNATILFGTDTFLSGYVKSAHPYDLFNTRYVFASAEKLKEETRRLYMEKFGIRVLEAYGATEAGPAISVNTPMHNKTSTAGRVLPNIEWKIEPIKGISDGGKLIIKGPNIMLGYYKIDQPGVLQPTSSTKDAKKPDHWYDTGDIAKIDDDGYLTLIGRKKRFAKIAGEMISLVAIEDELNDIWPSAQIAAASTSGKTKGEVIILLSNDNSITKQSISTEFKKRGISNLHIPHIITYVEKIPLLGSGKIDYVTVNKIAKSKL